MNWCQESLISQRKSGKLYKRVMLMTSWTKEFFLRALIRRYSTLVQPSNFSKYYTAPDLDHLGGMILVVFSIYSSGVSGYWGSGSFMFIPILNTFYIIYNHHRQKCQWQYQTYMKQSQSVSSMQIVFLSTISKMMVGDETMFMNVNPGRLSAFI